ncbi:G-type lectin S-receptor-like serine/threonine-protein kinase LECRK3 isoform X2 [Elaeis guineensis]|uniref:G-type lectin S-receptor-like serine/threonine-protein kinase LECRK3 isoform X2 n=1 Tax=Elaeis guineensis var. tenera TaxID=51953 RepID=UPI003C6CD695
MEPFSCLLHHHLLLQIIVLMLGPTCARTITYRNISLGTSLAARTGRTTAWLSPSGEFAFGFRPVEADGGLFLFAIWFDEIEKKTVVWCANGNEPVQAGATVVLADDGQLSLKDQEGQEVWNAEVNVTVTYAAMLDNGNFILASGDGSVRWQSFDHPSDTILPSQVLAVGKELRSRLMDTDYSSGRFKLSVRSDGNLTFYPLNIMTGFEYDPYWATNTTGNGSRLVFNESTGTIYLALNNTNVDLLPERIYSMKNFYQRATLDFDGVFRRYIYPKNVKSGAGWTTVGFQPPDICRNLTSKTGSGACGFNSYCTSGGGNQSVDCVCPPDYSFLDPNRKYKGCTPNFAPQNCNGRFTLTEMINVDWPLSAYEHLAPIDEDRCRRECLGDCNCAVAIYQYEGGNCWKKRLPLSNGKRGDYVDRRAFVKVPKVPTLAVPITSSKERSGMELEWNLFDMFTIASATDNFSVNNKLGEGGFGPVYKGRLDDGQEIAVKRLSMDSAQGLKEFKNEVMLIPKLQHKNLVRILGCCIIGEERMLIYEYMQNKSLDAFIFDKKQGALLNWQKRLYIIIGIARGLLYLHQDSRLTIIHRDLKASNILLDKDMNPKISDFGTARIFKGDQNQEKTRMVIGTFGYMSPEYASDGTFSVKSDVFSFGVLLLEILSGKKNRMVHQSEYSMNLIGHVWRLWEEGRCVELLDEAMGYSYPISKLLRCIQVGLLCVQEGSNDRPTMAEVVLMLSNEGVALQKPKRPGFCIEISLTKQDSSSSQQNSMTPNEVTVTMLGGR